jgi:hypothetical protein
LFYLLSWKVVQEFPKCKKKMWWSAVMHDTELILVCRSTYCNSFGKAFLQEILVNSPILVWWKEVWYQKSVCCISWPYILRKLFLVPGGRGSMWFSFVHACCLWKLVISYLEKCASSVNIIKDTSAGLPAHFQRNHLWSFLCGMQSFGWGPCSHLSW